MTVQENRKKGGNTRTKVPAVEHAAKILLFFANHDVGKANLTEICQALGLYKSRGHAILKTMAEYGLIDRDEATKRYSLGPALVLLSRKFLKHLDIREKALPQYFNSDKSLSKIGLYVSKPHDAVLIAFPPSLAPGLKEVVSS